MLVVAQGDMHTSAPVAVSFHLCMAPSSMVSSASGCCWCHRTLQRHARAAALSISSHLRFSEAACGVIGWGGTLDRLLFRSRLYTPGGISDGLQELLAHLLMTPSWPGSCATACRGCPSAFTAHSVAPEVPTARRSPRLTTGLVQAMICGDSEKDTRLRHLSSSGWAPCFSPLLCTVATCDPDGLAAISQTSCSCEKAATDLKTS
jgi:hypothetical protein